MLKRSLPTRLVPPLALFKLALALVAFAATYRGAAGRDPVFPYAFYGLFAVAFSATAALLLLGGRQDRRAVALGGFFLVTATAWCNRPLTLYAGKHAGFSVFALADALEVDGFMAYFLWAFVRDFPNPPASLSSRRWLQLAVRVSAAAGLLLLGLNLLKLVAGYVSEPGLAAALSWAVPQRSQGFYYSLLLALTGAAFPFLLWKARFARPAEQLRARLFLRLLTLTFAPMIVHVLLELYVSNYKLYLQMHPGVKLAIVVTVLLPGLTLPFTVPYAVLVHRVLDVKLIARRALQYLLARYTVLSFVTVPLAALGVYLYYHRGETLSLLFSGGRVPLLVSALLIGLAALRFRRPLLDVIDRRFFREQYDARQILALLVERIRGIQESVSLAELVSREIDLALHLEGIALLVLDPRSGLLADPRNRARRLDLSSALAVAISSTSDPLQVDLEDPLSPLLKLPEKERHWLVDSGFRLIVPILSRDGSLLGLVGLGEKKSGLPFLREDRQLLHAIASSAAWVLELEQRITLPPPEPSWRHPLEVEDPTPSDLPDPSAGFARECLKCGTLHPSYNVLCATCSRRLEVSRVPYVLPGRFRLEKRIGVGGMGVVYGGSDLALGRHVAIKTLRRVSPEDAMRLRREARTAAAVSHPHLAPIYGLETWRGTPMLVLELLEGGTLAQRIAGKTLPSVEIVDLGIAMADALAQLHAADILHRDIKPTNIGYTREGTPKLMDFGIARVMFELRQEEEDEDLEDLEPEEEDEEALLGPAMAVWATRSGAGISPRRRFVGTLSYLSPEALVGKPADATFDLWSLTVVLYEGLLGRKVFSGTDQQVMDRILAGRVPDFSQVCPDREAALGELFREALHRSPSRRPANAYEMLRRLEAVRRAL